MFYPSTGTVEPVRLYYCCMFVFSDRKRMSVILRTPEGEIKLLIKGAVSFENLALVHFALLLSRIL